MATTAAIPAPLASKTPESTVDGSISNPSNSHSNAIKPSVLDNINIIEIETVEAKPFQPYHLSTVSRKVEFSLITLS
jgi:hypothetical protein